MAALAVGWGNNDQGQLGYSNMPNVPVAVLTSGALAGKTVTQVSVGNKHACALTTDGGAYCWGANTYGQLGNGSTDDSPEPVAVLTSGALAGKTIAQVTTGDIHTCAVTTDGGAYCWGNNGNGRLGRGNTRDASQPVAVISNDALAGKVVSQIAAGVAHTCALTSEGEAYCWGYNGYGQLGTGENSESYTPVAVLASNVLAGKTIAQITAGESHTCAVAHDGGAYCWGYNGYGQLGNASTSSSNQPVAVLTSGALAGKSVNQITAGLGNFTCAVTGDGGASCWGNNGNGQLGRGNTTSSNQPVAVLTTGVLAGKSVAHIAAGNNNACAVTSDGGAYCWGYNGYGQLGNGNTTDSNRPVAVLTNGALAGKSVVHIAAGESHTCAATSDGGAYCWGYNRYGELGTGKYPNPPWPLSILDTGALAGKVVTQVSAAIGSHACAVTSDGGAYCWGSNSYGQLGTGNTKDSTVPVAVLTSGALEGKFVNQISVGESHTCAVTNDGAAYCWGYNAYGQLGRGNNTNYSQPTAVLTTGVLAGKTVAQIAAGRLHTCVATSDGGAYCWGYNGYGQMGNGNNTDSNKPASVLTSGALAGKSVAHITAGYHYTCAVTSDDRAYCWGDNGYGQLGKGDTNNISVPTAVLTSGALAGKSVIEVSAGWQHTCAVTKDGWSYCWGYNGYGQLGRGSTRDANRPVPVATNDALAGKAVSRITVGYYHTCAITGDGGAYCWGYNGYGQLGTGDNDSSYVPVAVLNHGALAGKRVTAINAEYNHTIALAKLPVTATVTVADKPYDGTTTAIVSDCTLSPAAEYVACDTSHAQANFADAGAGNGKQVTVNYLALSGTEADNYRLNSTSATATAAIHPAQQAPLLLTAPVSSLLLGGSTTFTATGGSGEGAVSLAAVNGGGATCAISGDTLTVGGKVGSCTVTATKAASANYLAGTSNAVTIAVEAPPAVVTLVNSASTVTYGKSVTLTVTVQGNAPTGSVSFYDGVQLLDTKTLPATRKVTLSKVFSTGAHPLTARYSGDSLNGANTSAVQTVVVNKAKQAALTVIATPPALNVGETAVLSTSGGSGPGKVTYKATATGATVCAITGDQLLATGGAGSCEVKATKAASTNYLSTTATLSVPVVSP